MYRVTRDGFAILAMGFTGKEAMRWKEAYIRAFNLMEAKLRSMYVAPLVSEQEFRNGIRLRSKLTLREQSHKTIRDLMAEKEPAVRRNLYWQLLQINETLGIPTESAEQLLGADAPLLLTVSLEGGAA
jgi:phage regulator Rha-like protein